MLTRSVAHMNQLIIDNLHKIKAIPFEVIIHLPRSGTIPASLLATYTDTPLASVDEFYANTLNPRQFKYKNIKDINKVLLVDDSIRSGEQMTQNIAKLKMMYPRLTISTLAIYSTKTKRQFQPTLFLAEHTDTEYMYPWFIWKSGRISSCAIDMDGVICRDCDKVEDDDGEKYKKFLTTAQVKFHTKKVIPFIITSRLEKYRPQTESWLNRNGFRFGQLFMGPWASKEDRKGQQAAYKAELYKRIPQQLYIESSIKEAPGIARMSGKKVWCIDNQTCYEP